MSKLKMPAKGNSAAMMAELQAEHAAPATDEETNVTTLQPEAEAPIVAPRKRRTRLSAETSSAPPPDAAREDRLATALDRAATDEMTVVTVRISVSLNHYIDEYVSRRRRLDPKSRYRKQDAVEEAFAAFYADHPLPPIPPDADMLQ
jgi:hypothetical protein